MGQHLGHRQLARDYQPISSPVLLEPTTAAITTIQGLEIVAVQWLGALEQTAIVATAQPNSSWSS
jgi:hypothetical protein